MNNELEFTGERFTPECQREIWYEHMHRYTLAGQLCSGLRVLDAACGEGYGSALLAAAGATVTGIDQSTQAIEHARQRYDGRKGLAFEIADCTALPFADASFDCVVSFETLEHVDAQDEMLAGFRRVLKPGGFALISSPDKAVYSDQMGIRNEFHVRELYRDELESLLARHFPAYRLLGQKLLFHSAIWSLDGVATTHLHQHAGGEVHAHTGVPQQAMYLLAVCAAREDHLPDTADGLWLFDDDSESVYRHYLEEIRRHMAAGGIIAERDREIESLRRQLARAGGRSWLARLLRR